MCSYNIYSPSDEIIEINGCISSSNIVRVQ